MAKKRDDEIIVYWGPAYRIDPEHFIDWNMFYTDPVEVLPELKANRRKEAKQQSILYCPAFNANYKNTFAINNVVDSKFMFDTEQNKWVIPTKYQVHPAMRQRDPYIENRYPLITFMTWLFVCEESLEMEIMAPYLHKTEVSKYGVITTGKFDIGSWYRPIHAEFLLWEGQNTLEIKKDEPYFYVRFNTDKKVVFKRFEHSEEVFKQSVSLIETKYIFGKVPTLETLYSYFAKTQTRKIMLNKIKKQVIDK